MGPRQLQIPAHEEAAKPRLLGRWPGTEGVRGPGRLHPILFLEIQDVLLRSLNVFYQLGLTSSFCSDQCTVIFVIDVSP